MPKHLFLEIYEDRQVPVLLLLNEYLADIAGIFILEPLSTRFDPEQGRQQPVLSIYHLPALNFPHNY